MFYSSNRFTTVEMCASLSVPIIKSNYQLYPGMPGKKVVSKAGCGGADMVASFSSPEISQQRQLESRRRLRASGTVSRTRSCQAGEFARADPLHNAENMGTYLLDLTIADCASVF